MKKTKLITKFIMFFLVFSGIGYAQKTIQGTVSDDLGNPLPGATVSIIGSDGIGSVTDFNGNYSIEVLDDNSVLSITYIGFTEQNIVVGSNSTINITLAESLEKLDEVVVTALGFEVSTDKLGYATSVVSNETITEAKETSLINSLSGKTAGVRIS
jgi:hypothetical protein